MQKILGEREDFNFVGLLNPSIDFILRTLERKYVKILFVPRTNDLNS